MLDGQALLFTIFKSVDIQMQTRRRLAGSHRAHLRTLVRVTARIWLPIVFTCAFLVLVFPGWIPVRYVLSPVTTIAAFFSLPR